MPQGYFSKFTFNKPGINQPLTYQQKQILEKEKMAQIASEEEVQIENPLPPIIEKNSYAEQESSVLSE